MNHDHTIAILGYNNHDITVKNINHLRASECEDRIFFWDNGSNPPYESLLEHTTNLEYHREAENRYVNPVWNHLLESCRTRFLTFLNNDCFILSPRYFDEMLASMRLCNLALTSTKTMRVPHLPSKLELTCYQRLCNSRPIRFLYRARRQGWLMTIDLEQFRSQGEYRIPDYLKIWYGDDWIWFHAISTRMLTAVCTNRYALHLDFPVTMSSEIAQLIEKDKIALERYGSWHKQYAPILHCKTRLLSRYV